MFFGCFLSSWFTLNASRGHSCASFSHIKTKKVYHLLDFPISQTERESIEIELSNLDKQKMLLNWNELLNLKPDDPRYSRFQDLREVIEWARVKASGTIKSAPNWITKAIAKANWDHADKLVYSWASNGVPIDKDKLMQIMKVINEKPDVMRTTKIGTYKSVDGATSYFDYIPPQDVEAALSEFLVWYQRNKSKMHPIELAARAHQRLTSAHVPMDGSGRFSRMVQDWILQANGFPPATYETPEQSFTAIYADCEANCSNVDAVRSTIRAVQRTLSSISSQLK